MMTTNTAQNDTLSIAVLALILAASNMLAFYLVSHYTDVLGQVF